MVSGTTIIHATLQYRCRVRADTFISAMRSGTVKHRQKSGSLQAISITLRTGEFLIPA